MRLPAGLGSRSDGTWTKRRGSLEGVAETDTVVVVVAGAISAMARRSPGIRSRSPMAGRPWMAHGDEAEQQRSMCCEARACSSRPRRHSCVRPPQPSIVRGLVFGTPERRGDRTYGDRPRRRSGGSAASGRADGLLEQVIADRVVPRRTRTRARRVGWCTSAMASPSLPAWSGRRTSRRSYPARRRARCGRTAAGSAIGSQR